MFGRPISTLLLLSLLYTSSAHMLIRQDASAEVSAESDPQATDAGSSFDSSAQSTDGSTDASATADAGASPTADSAAASATASTGSTGSQGGALGGAGMGGAYPQACTDCAGTYSMIHLCSSQGSSESCSPICTDFTTTLNCLSCLVSNGQTNFGQQDAQQIIWNLEAACEDLSLGVKSVDVTATPTTTGPFTTPPASATSGSAVSTSRRSKNTYLTNYHTDTRLPSVSASLSQVVNPTATGAAGRKMSGMKGAVVLGAMGVGAMVL